MIKKTSKLIGELEKKNRLLIELKLMFDKLLLIKKLSNLISWLGKKTKVYLNKKIKKPINLIKYCKKKNQNIFK